MWERWTFAAVVRRVERMVCRLDAERVRGATRQWVFNLWCTVCSAKIAAIAEAASDAAKAVAADAAKTAVDAARTTECAAMKEAVAEAAAAVTQADRVAFLERYGVTETAADAAPTVADAAKAGADAAKIATDAAKTAADAAKAAAVAKAAEVNKAEATEAIKMARARAEARARKEKERKRKCKCYEDMRGLVVCEGCKPSLDSSIFDRYDGHIYDGCTKLKLKLTEL